MNRTHYALALMEVLQTVEFKPFSQFDWYGYAGCETSDPVIAHRANADGSQYTFVLDGANLQVEHYNANGDEITPTFVVELTTAPSALVAFLDNIAAPEHEAGTRVAECGHPVAKAKAALATPASPICLSCGQPMNAHLASCEDANAPAIKGDEYRHVAQWLRDHGFSEVPVGQEDGIPFASYDDEIVVYVEFNGKWEHLAKGNWENVLASGSNASELGKYLLQFGYDATPAAKPAPLPADPYDAAEELCELLLAGIKGARAGEASDGDVRNLLARLTAEVNRWPR